VARVTPTADSAGKPGAGASATAQAARVVVDLKRGRVRVTPPADGAVNIVTPEGLIVVREDMVVSHDAERGTRVTPATPTGEGATRK
jgi:hypothetical protein